MKLLITTLTMIFISFGANAKNYKWQCQDILFKVEDPVFGKKKLYARREGKWRELCINKGSQITNDSFNCIVDNEQVRSFILDEETKIVTIALLNGKMEKHRCYKKK